MEKVIKKYRLTDSEKQEEDDLRYWKSRSIKEKIDAVEELRKQYSEMRGINLNEQRLQRVLTIVKLSQS